MSTCELSVILVVAPGHPDTSPSLRSILQATDGLAIEVIVVGGVGHDVPHGVVASAIRFLASPPETLVPAAWGVGIAAATGKVVACLSTEFTVHEAWAARLLPLLDEATVGVAGGIELGDGVSSVTQAMWLLRFAAFLPHSGPPSRAKNIPGDGACYRREAILEFPDLLAAGFWEIEFHKRWLASGRSLIFHPEALVSYHGPASWGGGMLLRFRHGEEYGATMVLQHRNSRLRHVVAAPMLPVLLIGRILRRLRQAGGGAGPVLRSILPLFALTGAWSAGEAVGALRAGPRRTA